MKVVLVFFAVVLIAAGFGSAFYYHKNISHVEKALDRERYVRITAEENFENAKVNIGSLQSELKRINIKLELTEKVVQQKKALNKSLKFQLAEVLKSRDILKSEIKKLKEIAGKGLKVPNPILSR